MKMSYPFLLCAMTLSKLTARLAKGGVRFCVQPFRYRLLQRNLLRYTISGQVEKHPDSAHSTCKRSMPLPKSAMQKLLGINSDLRTSSFTLGRYRQEPTIST